MIARNDQYFVGNYNHQIGGAQVMKKDGVVKRAELLAKLKRDFEGFGFVNMNAEMFQDPQKRVEFDAKYQIAKDQVAEAQRSYDSAFAAWARGGYQE